MHEFYRNKIVIITGGSSGLGKQLALDLLNAGAKVVIGDINPAKVVAPNGNKAVYHEVNVAVPEQVKFLVDETVREYGRLDYIFNNAGFAVAGEIRDVPLDQWDRIIDVNLRGVIHGIAAAYPVMLKQHSGHIINTGSVAGLIASPPIPAYSVTKFAVVGLSLNLRAEARKLGVKVSVICPGFIKTRIYDNTIYNSASGEQSIVAIPLKLVEVETASRLILEGIRKNRSVIIFPLYAKLLWWLQRLAPWSTEFLLQPVIASTRKSRVDPD